MIRNAFFFGDDLAFFHGASFGHLYLAARKCGGNAWCMPCLSIMSSSIVLPSIHYLTEKKRVPDDLQKLRFPTFWAFCFNWWPVSLMQSVAFLYSLIVSLVLSVLLSIGLLFWQKTNLNISSSLVFVIDSLSIPAAECCTCHRCIILIFSLMINN